MGKTRQSHLFRFNENSHLSDRRMSNESAHRVTSSVDNLRENQTLKMNLCSKACQIIESNDKMLYNIQRLIIVSDHITHSLYAFSRPGLCRWQEFREVIIGVRLNG